MPLMVPNIGETLMLDNALKTASPEALILKLYTNNYDCVETSVHTDFTECVVSGYAAKTLTRAGWGAAGAGAPSTSTYGTPQTFNFTGTGNIVGYYLVGAVSGSLYWAERLYPTTGQAFNSGDSLTVTPKITLD